jgi:site-specific recombinase XerD
MNSAHNPDAVIDEWADWLRDWLLAVSHEHAANTRTVYERGARRFLAFLAESGRDHGPEGLTRRDVEAYLAALRESGMAEATRRARLMTLRSWFGWMLREPGAPFDRSPAEGVAAPVVELPLVQVVSDDDLTAVLKTCETKTLVGLRDAAIIRLLLATGLRRAELVALDVVDVDVGTGELVVMGKGSKPRVVSFGGARTPLALSRYLRARRRHPGAGDAAPCTSSLRRTVQCWADSTSTTSRMEPPTSATG